MQDCFSGSLGGLLRRLHPTTVRELPPRRACLSLFRDRLTVGFEPLGKLPSAELPGRDLADRCDRFCFLRLQPVAVLEQKRPGGEQARPLVAVGKGMVLEEALTVGSCQFVGGRVLRSGRGASGPQGRFLEAPHLAVPAFLRSERDFLRRASRRAGGRASPTHPPGLGRRRP